MAESSPFMTTAEVAALMRAPEGTVRYWRHMGTGPQGFRRGRRVLYRREVVEQWLRDREAEEAAQDRPPAAPRDAGLVKA